MSSEFDDSFCETIYLSFKFKYVKKFEFLVLVKQLPDIFFHEFMLFKMANIQNININKYKMRLENNL